MTHLKVIFRKPLWKKLSDVACTLAQVFTFESQHSQIERVLFLKVLFHIQWAVTGQSDKFRNFQMCHRLYVKKWHDISEGVRFRLYLRNLKIITTRTRIIIHLRFVIILHIFNFYFVVIYRHKYKNTNHISIHRKQNNTKQSKSNKNMKQ